MFRLNKKGEEEEGLMANTLGVVLAVAAIFIIIVFIYLALIRITADSELESAQTLMNVLEAKINALSPGQSINHTIQGFKAETATWFLTGWGKNDPGPDKCFFESCICICAGHDKDACQNRGICRFFEVENIDVTDFKVKPKKRIDERMGEVETGWYLDDSKDYIQIPNNLLVVEIKKESNKLDIFHHTPNYLKYKDKIVAE